MDENHPLEKPSSDELARLQKIWLNRLSREEKAHQDFRDRSEEIEEILNVEIDQEVYEPLYWSVCNVEHVGVYSNQPSPDVRPRNDKQHPAYIAVSQLISRGLEFCVDEKSFDDNFHRCVDDFLGMGLGIPRVKIDSVITESTVTEPINDALGQQVGFREQTVEKVGDQTLRWEHIPWARFGWEPCNNWRHCDFIYIKHPMTRIQAKARFGKTVNFSKTERAGVSEDFKEKNGDIYEIWDRPNRRVIFLAKGELEPLEIIEDPLELKDFYPCPAPMMTNLGSEELVPKSDYNFIEQYDLEVNRLQERRASLLEQIKAAGAYDAGLPELGEMLELDDGQYKPVNNLIGRLTAAGMSMDKAVYHLPLQEKADVLRILTEQIGFVKAQVDEILGISDIVRGVTAASETATAQEIKGRWVGVRLTRKREIVQYTVREMMRIMGQLLASHITPENLQRMTQMEITEEMQQILATDMLMEFSIDIETDSTIAKDEFRERETFQEMLNGVAQFAQSVLPMVQQNAMPADISSAILRAALSPYSRADRGLEEAMAQLPTSTQQLQQLSQQMQQTQMQLQEAQMQAQQWQAFATQLQQQSTEAATHQKHADAAYKEAKAEETKANTRDKMGELPFNELRETAEISEIQSRARMNERNKGNTHGQGN